MIPLSKQSVSWKNLERKIADKMHGKRNYRGADFSTSMSDVEHTKYTFEAKYRAEAPLYYYNYFQVLKDSGRYTVIYHKDRATMTLDTFARLNNGEVKPLLIYEVSDKKRMSKFLEDSLNQASMYDKNKIPVLVYKRKNFHGEVVYMSKHDFKGIYQDLYLQWKLDKQKEKVENEV